MTTLMLIDGHSLTYRAFFALPTDMATSSGQVTNATFGFTSMLTNLVRDHQPDLIAVAFDRPEPTFRHEQLDSYKANREAAPDILRQQIGLVRQVVEALNLAIVDVAGFEADDVIATLATRAAADGISSIIVTGDRDAYQLVEDPFIRVLYNRKGVSDYVLYDEAGIVSRTGVHPTQYVNYAALRGDPSDNLPGVTGVGEKTAAKLINSYGSVAGIYEHLDEQTPKLRQNLVEGESNARRNVSMMKLVRDVAVPKDLSELTPGRFDVEQVTELFKFLEFGSLLGRVAEAFGTSLDAAALPKLEVITAEPREMTTAEAAEFFSTATEPILVAGAWEGRAGRSPVVGLAVVTDAETSEVGWCGAPVLAALVSNDPECFSGSQPWVGHDLKPLLRSLLDLGAKAPAVSLDTKIAAYLLDPADPRYALGDLLAHYAEAELGVSDGGVSGQLDFGESTTTDMERTATEAMVVHLLMSPLSDALVSQNLADLNHSVEVPLVGALARMEHVGVGVDVAALKALGDDLTAECERLRSAIIDEAGEPFNVNSTQQLRTILFDKLGLTPQKKTKTGASTDAASLEKLSGQHPIIEHLLAYREVEKLRGTYAEGLLAEVAPDNRIHATFHQTVARTGRLSSEHPNLHNIPVRTDGGRKFREVFVPCDGSVFLVADYNQIELRCIAHLAGDPGLIEAFVAGTDIHNETAARVFGVSRDSVNAGQRSKAKMVSYGLAYGMEAFGLAQRLNISNKEAQGILDAYFVAFPAVKEYMDRTVAEARERGYTETLFGRRRRIPELSSGVRSIKMAGERQAMNAGIQGLAADIFKVALVRIDEAFAAGTHGAKLVLQVHDEVICEVPHAALEEVKVEVVDIMNSAFEMRVPLAVNVATGSTWAAAKG